MTDCSNLHYNCGNLAVDIQDETSMFPGIFKRKAIPPATAPTEATLPHIVRHPLTREQAQERGALGHEARRQRKKEEALIMQAVAQKSPLLAVMGLAFPRLRKEVIWKKPELIEPLLKVTANLERPPGDNRN